MDQNRLYASRLKSAQCKRARAVCLALSIRRTDVRVLWALGLLGWLALWSMTQAMAAPPGGSPVSGNAMQAAPAEDTAWKEAVQAYRQGDYAHSDRLLSELRRKSPQDARIAYYLAITKARQNHIREAARLYEEVLRLEPDGHGARLAREGLRYLPRTDEDWDAPPRLDAEKRAEKDTGEKTPQAPSAPEAPTAPVAGTGSPPLSPDAARDWMAWQMMMGQTGQNGGWGNMLAPWMMMQQSPQNGAASGVGAIPAPDPELMREMMMNQALQGFMSGSNNNDRN